MMPPGTAPAPCMLINCLALHVEAGIFTLSGGRKIGGGKQGVQLTAASL